MTYRALILIGAIFAAFPLGAQEAVKQEKAAAETPADIRRQIEALHSESPEARMLAAYALGELGAAEAVPELIALLGDHGPTHQKKMHVWQPPDVYWGLSLSSPGREAARALVKIGAPSAEPLLAVLKDPKNSGLPNAIWALGEMREPRAVDFLLTRLWDVGAIVAIGKLREPRAAQGLVNQLDNDWIRYETRSALVQIGRPSVEPLIDALKNKDLKDQKSKIRSSAAELLGRMEVKEALEPLMAAALEDNAELRYRAVEAVGVMAGKDDAKAAELLRGMLKDKDWRVRELAAVALGRLGCAAAAPEIRALLADQDLTVRGRAAQALAAIGDKTSSPDLLKLLDDRKPFPKKCAVEALGALKEPKAVKQLSALLKKGDPDLRRAAAGALGQIGDPAGIAPLLAVMADDDQVLRKISAESLGKIGAPAAAPLADAMKSIKDGPDSDKSYATAKLAAVALGEPAVPSMTGLLACGNWRAEVTAGDALREMGEPGIQALFAAAKAGKWRAIHPISLLDKDKRAPDVLVEALKSGPDAVRKAAAEGLGRLKPRQAAVFNALVAALDDKSAEVKDKAEWALGEITRQYLGKAPAKWREWWKANGARFLEGKL